LKAVIERDAHLESVQEIRDFIEEAARRAGVDPSAQFDLKLAVDEACSNIVMHGYEPGKPGPIGVSFESDGKQVVVTITDRARPFDPKNAPVPDLDVDWRERRPGGLGWYLIHQVMDRVEYDSDPEKGNRLTLVKAGAFSGGDRAR
jgi:anti-sigma regulatory factor (Ser/Thr protein kinase)